MRKRKSHKKAIPSTGIEPKENIFEYSTKRPKRKGQSKRKADRIEKREILESAKKHGSKLSQWVRKKRKKNYQVYEEL